MNHAPLGHLKVSLGSTEAIVASIANVIARKKKNYCIPINVTKYGMSKSDTKLRDAINAAGFVVADGLPISWMARRQGHAHVQQCTGISLARYQDMPVATAAQLLPERQRRSAMKSMKARTLGARWRCCG